MLRGEPIIQQYLPCLFLVIIVYSLMFLTQGQPVIRRSWKWDGFSCFSQIFLYLFIYLLKVFFASSELLYNTLDFTCNYVVFFYMPVLLYFPKTWVFLLCTFYKMQVPFGSWCTWMCFSVCRESGKKPQADGEAAAAAGARPWDFYLPRWPKRHVPHENGYILYTCMHACMHLVACKSEGEFSWGTVGIENWKRMADIFFHIGRGKRPHVKSLLNQHMVSFSFSI